MMPLSISVRAMVFVSAVRRGSPSECEATPTSQFGAMSRRTGECRCDQGGRRQHDHSIRSIRARTGRPDPSVGAIMSERRQLINLAYRLLGSLADAEDVVRETYARWYAMSQRQQAEIESPSAWLTKVASRICLDLLGSARA
jgi:hypothetical protein